MSARALLLDKALAQVPRVLGFIDREASSLTYGCSDRDYWHYKTVDFVNARYQEAARLLALCYVTPSPKNRFYQNPSIKTWALAACEFWAQNRHGDGSVDESFPRERHFCATAFSLHAIIETYLLLNEIPRSSLSSSAEFIDHQSNPDVSNQAACAAAALYGMWQLSKQERWRLKAEAKIDSLLKQQLENGTFNEYGGFDLGYDTITLSLLADLHQRCGRDDVHTAAVRLAHVLDGYLDHNGYFDNKDMSRRTQFVYPYGFSVFMPEVLRKIEQGNIKDVILNPGWMDDRYCIPLTIDYLLASQTKGDA